MIDRKLQKKGLKKKKKYNTDDIFRSRKKETFQMKIMKNFYLLK